MRDDLVEAGAQALVKGDVHALVAVLGMTAPLRARQALGDRQVEHQREVRPECADHEPVQHLDGRAAEAVAVTRSEEHTSELQSLMRISYAVFCLTKKNKENRKNNIGSLKEQKQKRAE